MAKQTNAFFKVDDRSYFAIIKKDVHALVVSAGFSENRVGQVDIVVAEVVTNLVKHGGGGQLLVKLIDVAGIPGLELVCIDNGPGMTDVTRMVADGVSTKNTLGQGLGAIKRLSHTFQVYSQKGWGTVMLIRIMKDTPSSFPRLGLHENGQIVISKPGETACGDAFFFRRQGSFGKYLLADGLGHGPEAEKAALQAGHAFASCMATEPVEIIRELHQEVKKTRGLVGTVAVFDYVKRVWKICGVGNIMTKITSVSQAKNYMAYNGIIGLNIPRTLNSQEIAYEPGQVIVMCSDGIKSKWDTIQYPSIHRYDPMIIAASVFKDFARYTDDMSIATCKITL